MRSSSRSPYRLRAIGFCTHYTRTGSPQGEVRLDVAGISVTPAHPCGQPRERLIVFTALDTGPRLPELVGRVGGGERATPDDAAT